MPRRSRGVAARPKLLQKLDPVRASEFLTVGLAQPLAHLATVRQSQGHSQEGKGCDYRHHPADRRRQEKRHHLVDLALVSQRQRGLNTEAAIHEAARLRFRSILMTTMCDLLGEVLLMLGTASAPRFASRPAMRSAAAFWSRRC